MFNTLKNLFTKETNVFNISQGISGRFFITDRKGNIGGNSNGYARRRDAVRGAQRAGLTLA